MLLKNNFRLRETMDLDNAADMIQGSLCDRLVNGKPDPKTRVLVLDSLTTVRRSRNPQFRDHLDALRRKITQFEELKQVFVLVQDRMGNPSCIPAASFLLDFVPVNEDQIDEWETEQFLCHQMNDSFHEARVADTLASVLKDVCTRLGWNDGAVEDALEMHRKARC